MNRTPREELLQYISDAHKDAFGFRPQMSQYVDCSIEQLECEADDLSAAVGQAIEEEKQREAAALLEFQEMLCNVSQYLPDPSARTALRYLTSEEDFHYDQCIEHWVWNHGILFTDYGKDVVRMLAEIHSIPLSYRYQEPMEVN